MYILHMIISIYIRNVDPIKNQLKFGNNNTNVFLAGVTFTAQNLSRSAVDTLALEHA